MDLIYPTNDRLHGCAIDDKLRFAHHAELGAAKPAKVAKELARLMPNMG